MGVCLSDARGLGDQGDNMGDESGFPELDLQAFSQLEGWIPPQMVMSRLAGTPSHEPEIRAEGLRQIYAIESSGIGRSAASTGQPNFTGVSIL